MEIFQKNLISYKGNRKRSRFEIHATDIKTLCLRQFFIMYSQGIPYQSKEKKYPIRTYLTFRIGDKIEELVRDCLKGYKPKSLVVKIKDIYLIGNPDIIIDYNNKKYIVECKSIKREDYNSLTEPLGDHILQVSFYLWLADRYKHLGYEKKGFIIYVPKQESEPLIKIFPITLTSFYKEKFDNLLNSIKAFFLENKLPKRVCINEYSKLASECPVMRKCFILDEREKDGLSRLQDKKNKS